MLFIDMVIEHNAVQMIDFMLHNDRLKTLEPQLQLIAVAVIGLDLHLFVARHEPLH
ncbi:hypothetical protein D3C77_634560 [compost metagenome]